MKFHLHLIALFLLATAVSSTNAAEDARSFVNKVFTRATWQDMQGRVELSMTNKRGDKKIRKIDLWQKKNDKDESSMLMRFDEPADVRGTAFLLIEHNDGPDDRRLYLPALRRVQRISASGAGGNFMSSDFSYYDIGRPKLEDWTYEFGEDKSIDGVNCRTVIGKAASDKVKSDTGYSKVVWHIDPQRMVLLASDFFDKDGTHFKELKVLELEEISGTLFATQMRMNDITTGHSSDLLFQGLKTNQGLEDSLFTQRGLVKKSK